MVTSPNCPINVGCVTPSPLPSCTLSLLADVCDKSQLSSQHWMCHPKSSPQEYSSLSAGVCDKSQTVLSMCDVSTPSPLPSCTLHTWQVCVLITQTGNTLFLSPGVCDKFQLSSQHGMCHPKSLSPAVLFTLGRCM